MDDRENFCLGLIATEVSLSLDADTAGYTQYATNANDQGVHVDVGFYGFFVGWLCVGARRPGHRDDDHDAVGSTTEKHITYGSQSEKEDTLYSKISSIYIIRVS